MEPLYSAEFYRSQADGSAESARRILPIVFELLSPRSVVDVGCGIGTWLAVSGELGIENFLGIDGEYAKEMLRIEASRFRAADLTSPLPQGGRFDLAICMEVAEHLPESRAESLVRDLTRLAPAVLFSAAIPGQGGTNHINEQWQDYWIELFRHQGYSAHDCIRPVVWNDPRVEYWYAQNAFLFLSAEARSRCPSLTEIRPDQLISVAHPRAFTGAVGFMRYLQNIGITGWLSDGPSAFMRTFRRRVRRRR